MQDVERAHWILHVTVNNHQVEHQSTVLETTGKRNDVTLYMVLKTLKKADNKFEQM